MKRNSIIVKPKTLKGEDGHRMFSVRIKKETVQELEEIAAKTGRSRNELVGVFLEYAVKHCEIG